MVVFAESTEYANHHLVCRLGRIVAPAGHVTYLGRFPAERGHYSSGWRRAWNKDKKILLNTSNPLSLHYAAHA